MVLYLLPGCTAPVLTWPDVSFESAGPEPLRIGAAAVPITPRGFVFLAGGIPYRPALNVHDDIWARAVVIDDGRYRVALVALDLIGLYYDDVVRIRSQVAEATDVDYVLIAATHTHNAPDVLDVWSPRPFCVVDPYKRFLAEQTALAVAQAAENLRPARIRIASGTSGDPPLSRDTRIPTLIDDTLTVWQAIDGETGQVIATSVHYAVHPILVPSFNFDISSDFVHTLREAFEAGMTADDGPVEAQGGVCLFFNGALGGRITPAGAEPLSAGPPVDPAYAKAQAYGYRLARRAAQLLAEQAETLDGPMSLSVAARQIRVPVDNDLLAIGMNLCLIDRAMPEGHVNSEVAVVRIGPVEFFAAPGMIFPELVLGGIAPLPGSDFPDAPPESPPLAEMAGEDYFVVVGIANDMLGYVIPKALWDAAAPFTTGTDEAPYGELISTGPDAAGIIIDAFADLVGDM